MTKPTTITEFSEASSNYYETLHNILVSKQTDYGPSNIANAPGGPLNGLRVRIYDKISRINNLIESGAQPENESLVDSFLDLANYAVIATMVLDDKWPDPRRWEHE
ncbi:hypothetical protein uvFWCGRAMDCOMC455_054 [Freshwater phage uvFW-CGR-AMD-COM-C455]|nr:hypothetical protein uvFWCGRAMDCOMC455_054 [Freshwater phage uvFW-CGR-AMD-COM-C455]